MPDEQGNYVSSVPLTDLQEESDVGVLLGGRTDVATETHRNEKESVMTQISKWPDTVQALIKLAVERGIKPSELIEELERDLGRPNQHPSWCTDPECEGPGDHSGTIKSNLLGQEGQSIEADINMRDGKPIIAIFGLDDDFGRPLEHVKAVSDFLAEVCETVEAR